MALEAQFKRPFDEQVAFFRGKLGNPITTEKWTDVWKSAHDTGFMVAGAAKADLLADFAGAVDKTIAEGKSIGWFREQFDAIVEKHGWSYRGEYNWRTRTIYRTNMATSYAAGRLAQLEEGGFSHWMYRHSDSVAHPRPLHVSWDGLTLPANDPWWQTHYPPNGWGCQCYVIGVSERTAKRIGGRLEPAPDDGLEPDGRPKGIDKGWDYQPGATVADRVRHSLLEKSATLPAALGAAVVASAGLASGADFTAWADDLTHATGEIKTFQALPKVVVTRLSERGITPATAAVAVRDEDVLHAHRDTKKGAIPWDWYRELPRHFSGYKAVLLDKTEANPALLFVYDIAGKTGKLVVKIDFETFVRGGDGIKRKGLYNMLRTGKIMNPHALTDAVSYDLLDGNL